MSAIPSRYLKVNMPEEHRQTNWSALFLGAVAAIVAFWKGITGFISMLREGIAAFRTGIARLNAQDERIAAQDTNILALQSKDQTQQVEIDDLKNQLTESTKVRIQLAADNVKLQQELAAEKEKVLEKQLKIASLERAQNTALLHGDAKDLENKIEKIAGQG